MDLGLQDKVILVAAASKGLGFGIAQAVAQEGAKVVIGSRTHSDITAAAHRLHQETGSETLGLVLDASDPASIQAWVNQAIAHFGGVDGLVVNAGGPPAGRFDDFDDTAWEAAFNLTLMSSVRMIRAVLPSMRARSGGSILTVTSSSVKEPIDMILLSNVMRSGVTSLAKSISRSLAGEHIRVNNLVPGRIFTDRVKSLDKIAAGNKGIAVAEQQAAMEATIPLGRYGTPEEFGKAGAFLLSEAASYVTGETFVVDGGSMKTVW
jgi:3-oxoacyl-[acyl-carrier protein] reductase